MASKAEKRCIRCNQLQMRERFSKKQWKASSLRTCKACNELPSREVPSYRDATEKRRIVEEFPTNRKRERKRPRVFSRLMCGACKTLGENQGSTGLTRCICNSSQVDSSSSFLGVEYSPPNFTEEESYFRFKSMLRRNELVGTYDAVFFVSKPHEDLVQLDHVNNIIPVNIHRTIEGSAEIETREDGGIIGKTTLSHKYKLLSRLPSGGQCASFGEKSILGGRPIPPTMSAPTPEARADAWINPAGMLDLALVPATSGKWWNLDYDDPVWTYQKPTDCRLKVLANRVPAVLQQHACKTGIITPSLEDADALMMAYHALNSSTSWLCNHLNIPADVAMIVRSYTTPPPVFYFEPDDVFVVYHDSQAPDCYLENCVVLRKKADQQGQPCVDAESIALMNSDIHETPAEYVDLLFG